MPYDDPSKLKDRARMKLMKAVYGGKVIRPIICENCYTPNDVQGHHNDYSKPLEVHWLCSSCHSDVHKMNGGFFIQFNLQPAVSAAKRML